MTVQQTSLAMNPDKPNPLVSPIRESMVIPDGEVDVVVTIWSGDECRLCRARLDEKKDTFQIELTGADEYPIDTIRVEFQRAKDSNK